jgi:hypothetical protein
MDKHQGALKFITKFITQFHTLQIVLKSIGNKFDAKRIDMFCLPKSDRLICQTECSRISRQNREMEETMSALNKL